MVLSKRGEPTAAPVAVARNQRRQLRSAWVGPRLLGHRSRVVAAQIALLGLLVLFWQLGSGDPRHGALLDELFFGKPSMVFSRLLHWSRDGVMLDAIGATLKGSFIGFGIGSVSGVVVAFVLAGTAIGRTIFAPLIFLSYSIPRLAFIPMIVIWFGVGLKATVVLAIFVTFLYTFFAAYEGARDVDPELIAVTRLMRGSRWQIARVVTIPSALVWVALGLRIAVPQAFGAVIFAEIFAGHSGLGFLMRDSAFTSDPNGLIAATLVVAALAILLSWIVQSANRRLMRWRVAGVAAA